MWELDHKENWALKNWCFWTVVLDKTLESPRECKEIQLAHHKGHQSWMFFLRTDAEAETPVLWPPDEKTDSLDPDAGKDWRQEEKRTKEGETVGWHHHLYGHEFEQALGVGDRWESLVYCSPWGRKESDTTEQLNWTEILTTDSLLMTGSLTDDINSWITYFMCLLVVLLSSVWLSVMPWTAACLAFLSIIVSWSLLNLMLFMNILCLPWSHKELDTM